MFATRSRVIKAAQYKCVVHMLHALLFMFQAYGLPHVMYASQVWSNSFLMPGDVLQTPLQSMYTGFI